METKVLNLQGLGSVFTLLKYTFVIVPVVAGLDKFIYLLSEWDKYINPMLLSIIPFSGEAFMKIVGVIEIGAGLLVLLKPSFGGLVVAGWLSLIGISLIAGGMYLDVAVRDLVMAVSAFAMARFALIVHE